MIKKATIKRAFHWPFSFNHTPSRWNKSTKENSGSSGLSKHLLTSNCWFQIRPQASFCLKVSRSSFQFCSALNNLLYMVWPQRPADPLPTLFLEFGFPSAGIFVRTQQAFRFSFISVLLPLFIRETGLVELTDFKCSCLQAITWFGYTFFSRAIDEGHADPKGRAAFMLLAWLPLVIGGQYVLERFWVKCAPKEQGRFGRPRERMKNARACKCIATTESNYWDKASICWPFLLSIILYSL